MSDVKKFEIVGGKVVRSAQPNGVALVSSSFKCTMCKIREEQGVQQKEEVRQLNKKIQSLREELTRVQNARSEKREAYSAVDVERRITKECISRFMRSLFMYLKYVRIVIWTLKVLRDHPPGGFCVACEQADGAHDAHCLIARLFDQPGQVILEHKDVKINERDLPIPEELRLDEIEPMIDQPWGMYCDLKKQCHDHTCGLPPLKGKLYCVNHMPKGY